MSFFNRGDIQVRISGPPGFVSLLIFRSEPFFMNGADEEVTKRKLSMPEAAQSVPIPIEEGSQSTAVKTRPAPPKVDRLPPWNVLLHNDDLNDMGYVVEAIIMLTSLRPECAIERMFEAHKTGMALLLSTHQEHAELLQEQFASKGLVTTIEPFG